MRPNYFVRSLLDLCKFADFCWSTLTTLSGKIPRIIGCRQNVGRSCNVAFIPGRRGGREGKIAIHLWRLFSVSAATPKFEVSLLLVFASAQILRIHDDDDSDGGDDHDDRKRGSKGTNRRDQPGVKFRSNKYTWQNPFRGKEHRARTPHPLTTRDNGAS